MKCRPACSICTTVSSGGLELDQATIVTFSIAIPSPVIGKHDRRVSCRINGNTDVAILTAHLSKSFTLWACAIIARSRVLLCRTITSFGPHGSLIERGVCSPGSKSIGENCYRRCISHRHGNVHSSSCERAESEIECYCR